MSRGAQIGRPLKYGEPTIVKQFRIPESISTSLGERAVAQNDEVSKLLITALDAFLNGVSFTISEADQQNLASLAEEFGFDDPSAFAKHAIRRMLSLPQPMVFQFLLGQAEKEIEATIEAENEKLARKPAKVAAIRSGAQVGGKQTKKDAA